MASYYFRNTGNTDYNTASNWSLSDGGGADGAVPTSADNAYFSNNSGNCNIATGVTKTCANLDCTKGTGYTGSFTLNGTATLTVTNAPTFSSGMTLVHSSPSGSGGFYTGGGTFTTGGITFNWKLFTRTNALTITLVGNLNLAGSAQFGFSGIVFNKTTAETINVSAGTFYIPSGGGVGGTAGIVFTGGTLQCDTATTSASVNLNSDITFNGNTTITNYLTLNTTGGKTITYTSGTINWGTSVVVAGGAYTWNTGSSMAVIPEFRSVGTQTLNADLYVTTYVVGGGNTTFAGTGKLTTSGTAWSITNFSFITTTSTVFTLTNSITVTGTFTYSYTSTPGGLATTCNGNSFILGGNITCTGNAGYLSGTTTITYNGTGTWSSTAPLATELRYNSSCIALDFTVNTAGTLTFGNYVAWGTNNKTFTYTAGTVDTTTNNSIFYIPASSAITLNTNGLTFNRISFATYVSPLVVTLSSNLQANMINIFAQKTTFTGTGVFNIGGLKLFGFFNNATELVLKSGSTYAITGSIECFGSSLYTTKISALTPSSTAYLNFTGGRSQNILYCDFTDIDASGGNTIWEVAGTLTRTSNISQLSNPYLAPLTVGTPF